MATNLTMDMVKHLEHLPTKHGLPVPYVVMWSGMQQTDIEMSIGFAQNDSERQPLLVFKRGPENRDDYDGRLWTREGLVRSGEPLWGQVSAFYQRNCMTRRLCQVCGHKIQIGPINWIMAGERGTDHHTDVTSEGDLTTFNPPTCDRCVPVALAVCPGLNQLGYHHYVVRDYEIWGTSGEVAHTDGTWEHYVHLPYHPKAAALARVYLAKQTIVRFTDFDVVVP